MRLGKVTIIGAGLIGGSIGAGLKKRSLAREVVGCGHREESLKAARRVGAVDSWTLNPRAACQGAELVVLATPVRLIPHMAREAVPALAPGAIITDVGSTKASIVREIESILAGGVSFVGGHPLAGSEKRGVKWADANLFEGSICVLTPTRRTDDRAMRRVAAMWRGLGARVRYLSPERHDLVLACTSHLPHFVSCALARSPSPAMLAFAARGFFDVTRLASGDPGLWADICLANRKQIMRAFRNFDSELGNFRKMLSDGNENGITNWLSGAKLRRDRAIGRSGLAQGARSGAKLTRRPPKARKQET